MANSVSSILYLAGGDIARPANYTTRLTFPPNFASKLGVGNNFDILCSSVTIPTIKNEILEFKYKGHNIPIKGRSDYERSVSVTFMLDAGHLLKNDFDTWIASMDVTYVNPSNETQLLNKINAGVQNFGSMKVIGKNFSDVNVVEYLFEGLFPSSVSGVEFNGETVSTTLSITVEFSFSTFSSRVILGANQDILDKITNDLINGATDLAKSKLDTLGNNIEGAFSTSISEIFGKNEDGKESNESKQPVSPNFNDKFAKLLGINKNENIFNKLFGKSTERRV